MKQRKKQLLGILGLAAVTIMTAIACALPTYAESVDTTVRMVVTGPGHSLTITSPQDGETIAVNADGGNISITAKAMQEHLRTIKYNMVCTNESGVASRAEAESAITELSGIDEVVLTVPSSAGNSDCELTAQGFDDSGAEVARDQVAFNFRAMSVAFTNEVDEFGNPQVILTMASSTDRVFLEVRDKQGRLIFIDANGQPEPIEVTKDKFEVLANGSYMYKMYLPMNKYKAPTGSYDLVSTAYDGNGTVISMSVDSFYYEADAAGVPSTNVPGAGSIVKDLNISRADFILTGIIMFTVISGFALYLIFRKRRQA